MFVRAVAWVLATIFTSIDTLPGLDRLDTPKRVRLMLAEAPAPFVLAVYGSTLLFIVAPVLTVGWPVPAFVLSRRQRDRHAHRLSSHRIYLVRQTMLMLKTFGGLIWGRDPAVRDALGLPLYGADPGTWRAGGESAESLRAAGQVERP